MVTRCLVGEPWPRHTRIKDGPLYRCGTHDRA